MKITIVQPRVSYYVGGSEVVSLKHIEMLSKLGHQISLFTSKPVVGDYSPIYLNFLKSHLSNVETTEIAIPENYEFIYSEEPESSQTRWDRESLLFSMLTRDSVVASAPDLLLTYYIVDAAYRHLEIPNVVYLGGHPPYEIELYNVFLTFCDGVICNSRNVENHWKDKFLRNNVTNISVLPKAVNVDLGVERILPEGKRHIVFAGRLIHGKGVEVLISAFARLTKEAKDVHLWILGDGKERLTLEKQVQKLSVQDAVTFTGVVDNVQDYFKDSTLCVFPSTGREGLMTVVAEAMAAGACVISSTNVGNEELIESGHNGVLIEPDDSDLLYKAMNDLLENQALREGISIRARNFAVQNLSAGSVGSKLEAILRGALSSS